MPIISKTRFHSTIWPPPTKVAAILMKGYSNLKITPLRIFPPHRVQIVDTSDCTHIPSNSRLLSLKHHPESHTERYLGVHRLLVLGQRNNKFWWTCSITTQIPSLEEDEWYLALSARSILSKYAIYTLDCKI